MSALRNKFASMLLSISFGLGATGFVIAAEPFFEFDIAAAPLDQALAKYTWTTKEQLMISAAIADGRLSTAVVGKFTAEAALRHMVAGSGLTVRKIGGQGYSLVAVLPSQAKENNASLMSNMPHRFIVYSAKLQAAVDRALCARAETAPGNYRTMARLWIGTSGAIERAELLTSSGDEARDTLLVTRLQGVAIGVPPTRLPQPVTMLITGEGAGPDHCAAAERLSAR